MIFHALISDKTPFLPEQFVDIEHTIVDYVDELSKSGILILWGGEDISPSLYGESPNSYTQAYTKLSARDMLEKKLVQKAIELKIPIIGICRGAQFLCAYAGGKLVQHVSNHRVMHNVVTNCGKEFEVTSSHHQMMCPSKSNHTILAWSAPARSTCYLGEDDEPIEMELEPEIIYFPKINALAIQPHPEWQLAGSMLNVYLREQIEQLLLKRKNNEAQT